MKLIEIMFILPDLRPDQEEYTVSMLLKYLPRDVFRPSVLLLNKGKHYYNLNTLREYVEVIDLQVGKIRNSLTVILRQIKKRNPDIVFCNAKELNVYFAYFSLLISSVNIWSLTFSFSRCLNTCNKCSNPSVDDESPIVTIFLYSSSKK